MVTRLAPLRSNIDSAAGASLEARIDRAKLSRFDVARRVDRLDRQRPKRGWPHLSYISYAIVS